MVMKKKVEKHNPVAKNMRSSGTGPHKTKKDYSRKQKFKKDLTEGPFCYC
jgi:hypothetical protein